MMSRMKKPKETLFITNIMCFTFTYFSSHENMISHLFNIYKNDTLSKPIVSLIVYHGTR